MCARSLVRREWKLCHSILGWIGINFTWSEPSQPHSRTFPSSLPCWDKPLKKLRFKWVYPSRPSLLSHSNVSPPHNFRLSWRSRPFFMKLQTLLEGYFFIGCGLDFLLAAPCTLMSKRIFARERASGRYLRVIICEDFNVWRKRPRVASEEIRNHAAVESSGHNWSCLLKHCCPSLKPQPTSQPPVCSMTNNEPFTKQI